jgi:hypothetical protein
VTADRTPRRADRTAYSQNTGRKKKNRTFETVHELSMSKQAGFLTLVQPSSLICAQDAARGVLLPTERFRFLFCQPDSFLPRLEQPLPAVLAIF